MGQEDLTFTVTSLPTAGILRHGETSVSIGDTFTAADELTYQPGDDRLVERPVCLHGDRSG